MPKELIFFLCACCILILTVINLSVGFVVTGIGNELGTLNCAYKEDEYDKNKNGLSDKQKKYNYEIPIQMCKNQKAFHDMEYTAFIFDVVIGFVCGLLGLLHLFDVKIGVSKIGIIGLICGIIGFVLTFVYAILNGIVFTDTSGIRKRDEDGAYAERDGTNSRYKCIYFDFDEPLNTYALDAKISELIQKQYNYDKDYYFEKRKDITGCQAYLDCQNGYIDGIRTYKDDNNIDQPCQKIYVPKISYITNKDYFNRFLTTLILSLIVSIANIGLAIFGFLLFKSPADSTKVIAVEN